MNTKETESLIKLLDDPNTDVFEIIKSKLCILGPEVIPSLESAWENSMDDLFQSRIETIIQEIHQTDIKSRLKQWVDDGATDLFSGTYLITKFQYPDITEDEIRQKIDTLKKDIWLELNDNLTALEKIRIINHVLFEVHGFSRSSTFQNSAHVHFLNYVLDYKKGSPLSLAILYALIAQQLNIPVFGVALPKNFILCYKDQSSDIFEKDFAEGVLFYINPFNKGVVFGRKEIDLFIKQQKLDLNEAYYQPCSNKETIAHLLNMLIEFYESGDQLSKLNDYRSLLKILYI